MPELIKAAYHTLKGGQHLRYARMGPLKKARGTILVAPGRREFIEKKYAELGREFAERDFRTIYFEWRGQGLSDRFLNGPKRQRDHSPNFDIHLDDLRSFYAQIVKPAHTAPLIVCGHSMGGHLLLRWLIEDKPDCAAAILTAPMLAVMPKAAQRVSQALCTVAVHAGQSEEYAPGQHDYTKSDRMFAGNPLTHDPERFSIIERYFDGVPRMTTGGVTWQWLQAALHSMQKTQDRNYLARLLTPVLAMVGSKDPVTPVAQLDNYLKFLPESDCVAIPDALHDVMNEAEPMRAEAWKHIDRFLKSVVKA